MMSSISVASVISIVFVATVLVWASPSDSDNSHAGKKIWAVLVAGSSGWRNYRHQADVCHAYHILRNHGVPASQIITMLYDDIADHARNPYPGRIFNSPLMRDVYGGVPIDYRGDDVIPHNFAAILTGDKSRIRGGNGRVMRSTRTDHVFVYFANHGGSGILSFPHTNNPNTKGQGHLTVKEMNTTLHTMYLKGLYAKATFYVDACHSGSMFEHTLPKELEIYAATSANSSQSSFATYCNVPHLKLPCMGDQFSVYWMEDSDRENLHTETLREQFERVKKMIKNSRVSSYGETASIPNEPLSDFQGGDSDPNAVGPVDRAAFGHFEQWSTYDIPLRELYAERATLASDAYKTVSHRIHVMKKKRRYLENVVSDIVAAVLHDPVERQRVLSTYPSRILKLDCHHSAAKAFSRECFSFSRNPYALKYAYVLTNLCEKGIDQQRLVNVIVAQCAKLDDQIQHID